MGARLTVFLLAAIYLAVVGEWALAALSLAGLIPGLLGFFAAVIFCIALFVVGHYLLGALVAAAVAAVFYLSNPQWRTGSEG